MPDGTRLFPKVHKLSPSLIAAVREVIPDRGHIEAMSAIVHEETLPTSPARKAAMHLIWYARELDKGRWPITQDTVQ